MHAGTVAGLVAAPAHWPAFTGLLLANHALLLGAGLRPRSRLLGPNLTRLPAAAAARGEVALTFDDGPDPRITPQVLDLLDRHRVRATFFCIGAKARAWPALCREIAARGHCIENHSQAHAPGFAFNGLRGYARDIAAAQAILTELAGRPPVFFRAPLGLRSPLLDPVLARLGLRLASWTRRGFDTVSSDAERVTRRLLYGLAAGDILLLHDGQTAWTATGRPVVLEALPHVLRALAERGLRSVTLRAGTNLNP